MSKAITPATNKVTIINKSKVFNKYLCSVSAKKEDILLAGENNKTTPSPLVMKDFKIKQTFSTRKIYLKRASSDEFTQESQEVLLRKSLASH